MPKRQGWGVEIWGSASGWDIGGGFRAIGRMSSEERSKKGTGTVHCKQAVDIVSCDGDRGTN